MASIAISKCIQLLFCMLLALGQRLVVLRLKRKNEEVSGREAADGQRIVDICARRGYEISLADAAWAWGRHSEEWCAGWLFLGDDEEVLRYILVYMEES